MKRFKLFSIVAVLLCTITGAPALADGSVRGAGAIRVAHGAADGTNLFVQIAVNAFIDRAGVPQGTIAFAGLVPNELPHGNVGPGGPSDPYILAVLDADFAGNTAFVTAIVIASPAGTGNANGLIYEFTFVDNSATGEPDVVAVFGLNIDIVFPIETGRYTVRD